MTALPRRDRQGAVTKRSKHEIPYGRSSTGLAQSPWTCAFPVFRHHSLMVAAHQDLPNFSTGSHIRFEGGQ